MILSEYIKHVIETADADEISFDIGVEYNHYIKRLWVNPQSPNRVRFTIRRKKKSARRRR